MECFPKKTMSYLIMNQRNLHSSTMICYYLDYLPQPATSHTSLPTLPPAFRTTKTWGEKKTLFPAQLPSKAAASEAFLTGGNLFTHRPWWFICHAWHQHHQQWQSSGSHRHSEYLPQTGGDSPLNVETKPSIEEGCMVFCFDRFGGLQSSSAIGW